MRPQRGRKNLSNVIRVISAEWRGWLTRVTSLSGRIGSNFAKTVSPTKSKEERRSGLGRISRTRCEVRQELTGFESEAGEQAHSESGAGRGEDGASADECNRGVSQSP